METSDVIVTMQLTTVAMTVATDDIGEITVCPHPRSHTAINAHDESRWIKIAFGPHARKCARHDDRATEVFSRGETDT